MHRLVHRQVERTEVDDLELAVFLGRVEVQAELGGPLDVLGGRSSKMATIPGSPLRRPSAMNCVARTDLPDPDGPATSRLSPFGNAAAHHLVQFGDAGGKPPPALDRDLLLPVRPKVRGKACSPSSVMRKVCRPGTDAWPRSFMICSFRTIELRSTLW